MAYIYKNESAFDKVVGSPTGGSITVPSGHYVLGAYFSRYSPSILTALDYDDMLEELDEEELEAIAAITVFTQQPSVLDGSIDTEDITDEAVTFDKIHTDAVNAIVALVPEPELLTNITETPNTLTTYKSDTHAFKDSNNDPIFDGTLNRVRINVPLAATGHLRIPYKIFLGGDGDSHTGLPCIHHGSGAPDDGDGNADGSLYIRVDASSAAAYLYVKLSGSYTAIGA